MTFLAFTALHLQKLITRILDLTHWVLDQHYTTIFWTQVPSDYSKAGPDDLNVPDWFATSRQRNCLSQDSSLDFYNNFYEH